MSIELPLTSRHRRDIVTERSITKTCLYNFDPLKPNFYIVKLGFTGYTLFFLFLLKNIDCGYSLEPSRRVFYLKTFSILEVKFSVHLNRRVFIMVESDIKPKSNNHENDLQTFPLSHEIVRDHSVSLRTRRRS